MCPLLEMPHARGRPNTSRPIGPSWPRRTGISFSISWECWNSAQSILMQARGLPNNACAIASTTRVLPEPVGPKNKKFAIGRPGGLRPATNVWKTSIISAHCLVLTNYAPMQSICELTSLSVLKSRVEFCCSPRHKNAYLTMLEISTSFTKRGWTKAKLARVRGGVLHRSEDRLDSARPRMGVPY